MSKRTPADVQAALKQAGLEIEIKRFSESTKTAPQAAEAVGCELGSIVKSLCFTVEGKPVLILTSGDRRVDDKKIAALYDVGRKRVKIADSETTISVTGYAPGGVPPVGLATDLDILIDDQLGRYDVVYAAAGSAYSIFPIPFDTLVSLTSGQIKDISK